MLSFQVAFTIKELREMVKLQGCKPVFEAGDFQQVKEELPSKLNCTQCKVHGLHLVIIITVLAITLKKECQGKILQYCITSFCGTAQFNQINCVNSAIFVLIWLKFSDKQYKSHS